MARLIRRGTVALPQAIGPEGLTRRDLCELIAAATAGAALSQLGCSSGGPGRGDDASAPVDAAGSGPDLTASCAGDDSGMKPGDVPVGTATFFTTSSAANTNAFVCHDAKGFFGLSSQCTHEQCDVGFLSQASGFRCPCHRATFDFDGNVTMGPAQLPLDHYALCVGPTGTIFVDTGTTVDAAKRYAL